MFNQVILVGRLGQDPKIFYSHATGKPIAQFPLATSNFYKKGDEKVEETTWHKVVAFNNRAEFAQKYLKKGSLVFIDGRIRVRKWEKEDKETVYITEVVPQRILNLTPLTTQEDLRPPKDVEEAVNKPTEEELEIDDTPF